MPIYFIFVKCLKMIFIFIRKQFCLHLTVLDEVLNHSEYIFLCTFNFYEKYLNYI